MNKKYILSILVFFAIFITNYNQASVAQTIESGNRQEFVDEDKSDKILFPQQTEAEKKQFNIVKKMPEAICRQCTQ